MALEFSLYVNVADKKDFEEVKTFVKDFYSCLFCINENVDSSCGSSSVCADCLGVDREELDFVADSILKGSFVKELVGKGFSISSLGMNLEEIGVSVATFSHGEMDYRAISYYDEDEDGDWNEDEEMNEEYEECEDDEESCSAIHITGSAENGFQTEGLPYEEQFFQEINDQYMQYLAEAIN